MNQPTRTLQFRAEVTEVGDGYVGLMRDGLVLNVPCTPDDERWFGKHLHEEVEVTLLARATE